MQSIVLYSPTDPALLVKAYEMLLEGGVPDDKEWNEEYHPISGFSEFSEDTEYLLIDIESCSFFSHDCIWEDEDDPMLITLTLENLNDSVRTVLENFNT